MHVCWGSRMQYGLCICFIFILLHSFSCLCHCLCRVCVLGVFHLRMHMHMRIFLHLFVFGGGVFVFSYSDLGCKPGKQSVGMVMRACDVMYVCMKAKRSNVTVDHSPSHYPEVCGVTHCISLPLAFVLSRISLYLPHSLLCLFVFLSEYESGIFRFSLSSAFGPGRTVASFIVLCIYHQKKQKNKTSCRPLLC